MGESPGESRALRRQHVEGERVAVAVFGCSRARRGHAAVAGQRKEGAGLGQRQAHAAVVGLVQRQDAVDAVV